VNDDIIANIAKLLKDTINNNWQTHLVNFKKDDILLLLISEDEDDLIEIFLILISVLFLLFQKGCFIIVKIGKHIFTKDIIVSSNIFYVTPSYILEQNKHKNMITLGYIC
ncbi:hypothetical protein RFI_32241, partial [Reticulomyxa filosa]